MSKDDIKLHEKQWFTAKTQRLLQKLNKKYTHNGEYLFKKLQNRIVNEIRSTRINHYITDSLLIISQT